MSAGQISGCGTSGEGGMAAGQDSGCETFGEGGMAVGQDSGCESSEEGGMAAGQDSPQGGMGYAARRKRGPSACEGERESDVAFFLGRIPQVGEGLERNGFGGMVKGVYTWVW